MSQAKNKWNERYAQKDFAYGVEPNVFLKESLAKYNIKGNILFAAEGEGRNAVYAAKKGLKVSAFDISEEGQKKALQLAQQNNVNINYEIGDLFKLDLINHKYDAAALIYAHLPPEILTKVYPKIAELIHPNGFIILEGFSKNNLKYRDANPSIGGPNNIDFLFSKDLISSLFPDFEIVLLEEKVVELNEGLYHNGTGSVIRFIGRKK